MPCGIPVLCGINPNFLGLSPCNRQVAYVLLTRAPVATRSAAPRLACVKPVASVHPEPGSNSSLLIYLFLLFPCALLSHIELTLLSFFLPRHPLMPQSYCIPMKVFQRSSPSKKKPRYTKLPSKADAKVRKNSNTIQINYNYFLFVFRKRKDVLLSFGQNLFI